MNVPIQRPGESDFDYLRRTGFVKARPPILCAWCGKHEMVCKSNGCGSPQAKRALKRRIAEYRRRARS